MPPFSNSSLPTRHYGARRLLHANNFLRRWTADALIELLVEAERSNSTANACRTLALGLQERFAVDRVAIGVCQSSKRGCRLTTVSDIVGFDAKSEPQWCY